MRIYDRYEDRRLANKDMRDEDESLWWCDYFVRDDMWDGPSMEDVRLGRFLILLKKLKIKSASEQLEYLYW